MGLLLLCDITKLPTHAHLALQTFYNLYRSLTPTTFASSSVVPHNLPLRMPRHLHLPPGLVYSPLAWIPCIPVNMFWGRTPISEQTCFAYGSLVPEVFSGTYESHTGINMALDLIVLTIPVPLYFPARHLVANAPRPPRRALPGRSR